MDMMSLLRMDSRRFRAIPMDWVRSGEEGLFCFLSDRLSDGNAICCFFE